MENRKCFLSLVEGYYEGDRMAVEDQEVPRRPDHLHDWIGSSWVLNETKANEAHNEPIYAQLEALDIKSIRAIREGDSARVAALEAQASELRASLAK